MNFCDKCGFSLDEGQNFCPHCGNNINGIKPKQNVETFNKADKSKKENKLECPKCGSENVHVQIVTKNQNTGCLGSLIYIILALTIVGIPIMILILLLKGKKTTSNKVYICQDCGKTFYPHSLNIDSKNNPIAIILVIICFIIIVGVGVSFGTSLESTENKYPYTIENSQNVKKDVYSLGEEIYCKNQNLIVNDVNYSYREGDYTPQNGYKYIVINVTVKNTSDSERSVYLSDFDLITSNGEKIGPRVNVYEGDFSTAELISNGSKTGVIRFEVASSETATTLVYKCGTWPSDVDVKVNTSK